jgi:hypothetical protein
VTDVEESGTLDQGRQECDAAPKVVPFYGKEAVMRKYRKRTITLSVLGLLLCANLTSQAGTRTVTDMAGRTVTVPATINRVVTAGSIAAINASILAMDKGNTIVSNLPKTDYGRCRYEYFFAPNTPMDRACLIPNQISRRY